MGYLDSAGLVLFKTKQDQANSEKYATKESVPTDVSDLGNSLGFQTAEQVSNAIKSQVGSVYTYKGSVESYDKLPKSNNNIGDVYDVADGMNYAWTGTKWDALGTTIEVDASLNASSTNPVQNKAVKAALDGKASTAAVSDSANGLMTPTQKAKLDGIQDKANAYSHPTVTIGAKSSGFYKVATDNMGHVTGIADVTKEDITRLGIPGTATSIESIPESEITALFS